jgi:pyruvate formate lyase activating enzyme
MIFNIQRFSTHDGAGIRTIIFYKGCPLQCAWCCNPESQSFDCSVMLDNRICRSFGDCLKACPEAVSANGKGIRIDRSRLQDPEMLRNVCLSRALTISGEDKSVIELMTEIEKDLPFYNHSGGGVTLSGGEPLSQDGDLVALLKQLKKKNVDVAIETSLHVTWHQVERCIGLTHTFLVDVKHTDPGKFHLYTKGNLGLVDQNLQQLARHHANIIVRIPVIPDFNHTPFEMNRIIDYISTLHTVREIHFLPYHTLGREKYAMLGMEYAFGNAGSVDESSLIQYIEYANEKGFTTCIGG